MCCIGVNHSVVYGVVVGHSTGAYPGFEKGGCLRTVVVSIYRAQSARNFFRTNCACASSTWLLLLVGVVDVGCPAQFIISANVKRAEMDGWRWRSRSRRWRDSST